MMNIKGISVSQVNDVNYDLIRTIPQQIRKTGNPGSKHRINYKDIVCAFDIETTRLKDNDDNSIMYLWQFAFDSTHAVIGRDWESCMWFFHEVAKRLAFDERIVIYIHNASFEFFFFKRCIQI